MIDESLLKSNYLGKDGFIWWLGQVAPPDVWDSEDKVDINFVKHDASWAYRCKVRIIGYHTYDRNELPDNDLPWAHVMLTPTDGNAQGGLGKTHKLIGGETVFGFFLDGDDAQQPVIVGSIYRNSNVQSFDVDEIAYKPFKGNEGRKSATLKPRMVQGSTKMLPKQGTQEAPNLGDALGNIIGGDMKNPTTAAGIGTTSKTGADKFFPCDKALNIGWRTAAAVTIISENGCDDNIIGKITRAIQNFIAVVGGLESYLSTYIDPVLNTFVDIANEIKRTARIITGAIKFLVNNMRDAIIKLVGRLFYKFIGLIVPIPQQPIAGEASKKIINIIFCLFENVIELLLPYLEDMLQGLVGRAINAPLCAVEEFVATVLNKLIDIIDDLLAPVMSGLDWLMNGISQVKTILSQATSIATQIFNLIGCDNLKCKTPSQWALEIGPSSAEYDNWNSVVSKMNVIRGFNDDLDTAVNSLSIYGGGSSIFSDCADRVQNAQSQSDLTNGGGNKYTNCIPPEVQIYGDGVGAQAIAVVGDNGSILSIELINQGYGYTKPPTISIVDKTNYGTGARASASISGGIVSQIYLTSSGTNYCPTNLEGIIINPYYVVTADRYSFYEGESVTFTITTENVKDGTILKYQIGGELTPSDINGPVSGSITIFGSKATVVVKTKQDSVNETLEQLNFDLIDGGGRIVARTTVLVNDSLAPILQFNPPNPIQAPPGTGIPIGTGESPKTPGISTFFPTLPSFPGIGTVNSGILTGIVISKPGTGYTGGDVIDIGGCTISPIVSPSGSIVGVSSVFCPIEFTSLPNSFIDSNTGEGAELYPVIRYVPKVSISTSIALNQVGVLKIVDCV
jgi:hypothetical protein